jgi:predicted helicase
VPIHKFIAAYNAEVHRHKSEPTADWPDHIDWSKSLKLNVTRGSLVKFDESKIVPALYRPFARQWLYFDRILNERTYQWPNISGPVIVTSDIGWRAPTFNSLMTNMIAEKHLCATIDAHQCFPVSHLKDSAVGRFREHYSSDAITKENVIDYIYALLHHPEYCERYAANLKLGLPRVPFARDFDAFVAAGRDLAHLHVD